MNLRHISLCALLALAPALHAQFGGLGDLVPGGSKADKVLKNAQDGAKIVKGMAGNVGLLKHASNVSHCALEIEKIFTDAGFDYVNVEGVLRVRVGDGARPAPDRRSDGRRHRRLPTGGRDRRPPGARGDGAGVRLRAGPTGLDPGVHRLA